MKKVTKINATKPKLDEWPREDFTCVGFYRKDDTHLGVCFMDQAGNQLFYAPKASLMRKFFPGGVWSIEIERKGEAVTVRLGTARYQRRLSIDEEPRVVEWEAAHRQATAEHELAKNEALAKNKSAIEEALKAIIKAGSKTNAVGRAALKMHVLITLDRAWRYHV